MSMRGSLATHVAHSPVPALRVAWDRHLSRSARPTRAAFRGVEASLLIASRFFFGLVARAHLVWFAHVMRNLICLLALEPAHESRLCAGARNGSTARREYEIVASR